MLLSVFSTKRCLIHPNLSNNDEESPDGRGFSVVGPLLKTPGHLESFLVFLKERFNVRILPSQVWGGSVARFSSKGFNSTVQ